ncbi:MAG TPA: response regulator transcription factor [Roseiarcus sp.]|nr:response regulator transcription factor [Roseiarcus sp.]
MAAVAALTDDPVLRGSLGELPRQDPTIALAGIVAAPADLVDLVERQRVDVAIVEARLAAQLTEWPDQVRLIVLCEPGDEEGQSRLLEAQASAFLPRNASQKTLAAAIHAVLSGLIVAPRRLLHTFLEAPPYGANPAPSDDEGPTLTPRELEVLAAMADGLSNKAIARRLAISFHTVKFHVAAILEKLGADTRTEAVMKAAQRGLVML